ncbi:MAG TPA: choice-of-anchor D domain-containing protein [Candidatus Acidoferrales bacterium]|nr:choice-of-anchor D domain-containing protein [Candidatus Acidoferrales bacterium]
MPAATGDNIADSVLGQIELAHNGINNPGAGSLDFPGQLAIDRSGMSGHLYVVDGNNSRVLGWNDAATFVTGQVADIVIGQDDFEGVVCNNGVANGDVAGVGADSLCNPDGVGVDSQGNLYVADSANNRVLEFNQPFAQGKSFGFAANAVFGQAGSFTAKACTHTATGLCFPQGLALDAIDNLYVADADNNRVLEFNQPLAAPNAQTGAGDATADLVFGQGATGVNFTGQACVSSGNQPASATGMCNPTAVALDASGDLFVGDDRDFRVLEFKQPLAAPNLATGVGDVVADRVFGQGSTGTAFAADTCFDGSGLDPAPSADGICDATAIAVDDAGDLFVTDFSNSRVLEYLNPGALGGAMPGVPGHPGDVTADVVFGQGGGFSTGDCNFGTGLAVGAGALCLPDGVAIDSLGDVLVADANNNRVLRYNHPVSSPPDAGAALGQFDLLHSGLNNPTGAALQVPQGVAIDSSGGLDRLYVADSGNNRVLGWSDAATFAIGDPADIAIGQPDLNSTECNDGTALGDVAGVGADSLCGPKDVGVDALGHLYIADAANNRVLEYNDPFGAGQPAGISANRVFGQNGSFTTGACNFGNATISSASLCDPEAVASDAAGNLFVADQGNNRVLEFNLPLAAPDLATGVGDAVADRVFGQAGNFTTGACNAGNNTISADTLCGPDGLAVDAAADLFVADVSNSRVLEFNQPLATLNAQTGAGDTTADRVFGQGAAGTVFTTNACASSVAPPPPSTTGVCRPAGVALDAAGDLFVADSFNNRVLEYNQPLAALNFATGAGDVTADRVFGQGATGTDFASSACADGGPGNPAPSGTGMCRPGGVAMDALGNMFVADESNNRVLRFDNPLGPLSSPTATPTSTTPATPTVTATPTVSMTPTPTPSATPTPTVSATPTVSMTPTATASVTPTATASTSVTATATSSPTPSATVSPTATSTVVQSPSATPTGSATSTSTASVSATPTPTASVTPTATASTSVTATATSSPTTTTTPSPTATSTVVQSPSATPTDSATSTAASTPSPTPTATSTATASASATSTATRTTTATPTPTLTSTPTPSATASPGVTPTPTPTPSPSGTPASTATTARTPVNTPTATSTSVSTPTATVSPTATATPTTTPTPRPTPTQVPVVLKVSPRALKLGNVVFGASGTSKPKHVTISNKSKTIPVTFIGIAASGDFARVNGCAGTIAPKAKCTVTVTFSPTVAGARSGMLTITDNATNSPQTVPLSGVGTAPK